MKIHSFSTTLTAFHFINVKVRCNHGCHTLYVDVFFQRRSRNLRWRSILLTKILPILKLFSTNPSVTRVFVQTMATVHAVINFARPKAKHPDSKPTQQQQKFTVGNFSKQTIFTIVQMFQILIMPSAALFFLSIISLQNNFFYCSVSQSTHYLSEKYLKNTTFNFTEHIVCIFDLVVLHSIFSSFFSNHRT